VVEFVPAPLDPAELAAATRPFGESVMLPTDAYRADDVLAWERKHLFEGGWVCVGRPVTTDAVASQRAVAVGDLSVVIAQDDSGVRAFANFCRHRGHELIPVGCSFERSAIVCPYHGWAYTTGGALKTAPRMGDGFDRAAWPLVELPCVVWHGWIFVNASGDAPDFHDLLGDLAGILAPYQAEKLVSLAAASYVAEANWKILIENYHECYHCPLIHPELCVVTSPTSGDNWHGPGAWVGGSMQLRDFAVTMSIDGKSNGVPLPGVEPRYVHYVGLFPNLLISAHPDYVMTHRITPLTPSRSLIECEWLFGAAEVDPAYAVDFWDLTNKQDWAACESVQRGIASPRHRPGPLAPNENAIYDWVSMMARAYCVPHGAPRR
jgi:phenylpropionate dioxygenase-like ring-hydroxylating dioxygenase large terminal subunit